jgi:hypothetical protein
MGAVSTHNAIHAPVFWDKRLNSFYQVCLSLQYGFSVSVFIPGHNLSHHKYPQQAKDFSEYRPTRTPSPCIAFSSFRGAALAHSSRFLAASFGLIRE